MGFLSRKARLDPKGTQRRKRRDTKGMQEKHGTQEQDDTKFNPEQDPFPFTMFPLLVFLMCLQFDTNGDGEISTSELREAMKKLLGQQVGHRDIEEIIRDVDLNGDGRVDFEGEKE